MRVMARTFEYDNRPDAIAVAIAGNCSNALATRTFSRAARMSSPTCHDSHIADDGHSHSVQPSRRSNSATAISQSCSAEVRFAAPWQITASSCSNGRGEVRVVSILRWYAGGVTRWRGHSLGSARTRWRPVSARLPGGAVLGDGEDVSRPALVSAASVVASGSCEGFDEW